MNGKRETNYWKMLFIGDGIAIGDFTLPFSRNQTMAAASKYHHQPVHYSNSYGSVLT